MSSVAIEGDHASVALQGEIDVASADQLRRCLVDCLAAGCTSLTLDMAAVDFLDSSGLRILVEAARSLRAGELTLRNPTRTVRRLVEITRLEQLLRMEPGGSLWNGHPGHREN